MNIFPATIGDNTATLTDDLRIPLPAHLRELANGRYHLAIRASDCTLASAPDGSAHVPVPAVLEVQEISGSETFAYLRHGPLHFVVREPGVVRHPRDSQMTFYLNPDRLLAFEPEPGSESQTAVSTDQALLASYR